VIKSFTIAITGMVLLGQGLLFPLTAQTVTREREATITGPRGRTIDRRLEVNRGPGTYERQLSIQRPGGTLQRDFLMQRVPRVAGLGAGGYGGRPMVFERNVFVAPRPAASWSFGFFGAPIVALPFWQPAPPPPVVIAPQVGMPGVQPGARPAPGAAANPSPLDPVALAAQRLQSFHASSRRDGAQTLGRLGDPRAVPALVHALKYDSSKDVKIAAAQALGQIGGTDSEVVLERCIVYEKKEEVRDAAALALRRLRDRRDSMAASSASSRPESRLSPSASGSQASVPRLPSPSVPPASSRPSPFRNQPKADEPALEAPGSSGGDTSDPERVPPPPPSPVSPN
jgi:HEAT repeat protein